MSKRVKKRFTSEVNIIDFQPYLPQKKQRVSLYPRNANQEIYLRKLQDDAKSPNLFLGNGLNIEDRMLIFYSENMGSSLTRHTYL